MSGPSSNTSFFSFGPGDSFLSKSYEGLRYRHLPSSLHQLIAGGNVTDVYWGALGPVSESWVLSFRDKNGKNNLGWGSAIPSRLSSILSKISPTPHLRIFLGPPASYEIPEPWRCDSFIAWDPNFLRWGGLPHRLEDCLQSWLTPAGWKSGPPRLVTWGKRDAFFAMSEYGDVVYRLGTRDNGEETWSIYKETVEEWKEEVGFEWSELAYISLDPVTTDQFIAIRSDGTWAGSIDGTNEDALESFSLNYFQRTKNPRSSSKPTNGTANGTNGASAPESNAIPNAQLQAYYEQWATSTATALASALSAINNPSSPPPPSGTPTPGSGKSGRGPKKLQIRSTSSASKPSPTPTPASIPTPDPSAGKLLSSFPYLPPALTTCALPACVAAKAERDGIRACRHDVERMLRASGLYSKEWLRQERIRWHPDRFGRLCEEGFREVGRRMAEEMFKVIDGLIGELEGGGRG
ncbi:hypothetical protein BS50DRAFT_572631 [Corynespora cassiicola Philippines]|uniref:Uncharacterized protein n=1 Tax=Corynespora cassiicola Philippines TaxID=1448308 RepID=A0A2T2NW53_CORCC|nr:hypothetical protein BS50DRAFT_572631 [Corynespora cassiicola Philippines]